MMDKSREYYENNGYCEFFQNTRPYHFKCDREGCGKELCSVFVAGYSQKRSDEEIEKDDFKNTHYAYGKTRIFHPNGKTKTQGCKQCMDAYQARRSMEDDSDTPPPPEEDTTGDNEIPF